MVAVAVQHWPVNADTPERPRLRPVTGSRRRRVFWFRRFMALALLAAIAAALWFAVAATLGWIGGGPLTAAGQPGGMRPAAQHVWVVRPGDTLWGIAAATGDHGDLRPLVDRLSDEIGGRP
ncbi:MAG: LysM peptidoglycan-binding domain-containing protein, partial [Acidimicrobiaceae bacterium]|nr:LysM peptidoglycan-binding domain-containing protein [Acidimicrobiaceae bacterium]